MTGFEKVFSEMETRPLQDWLRTAQHQLTRYKTGAVHEILMAGISTAATELLFRYRQEIKNLA